MQAKLGFWLAGKLGRAWVVYGMMHGSLVLHGGVLWGVGNAHVRHEILKKLVT